jgi:hypothetical protein
LFFSPYYFVTNYYSFKIIGKNEIGQERIHLSNFNRRDLLSGINDVVLVQMHQLSFDEAKKLVKRKAESIYHIVVEVTGLSGASLGSLRCKCCFEKTHTPEQCDEYNRNLLAKERSLHQLHELLLVQLFKQRFVGNWFAKQQTVAMTLWQGLSERELAAIDARYAGEMRQHANSYLFLRVQELSLHEAPSACIESDRIGLLTPATRVSFVKDASADQRRARMRPLFDIVAFQFAVEIRPLLLEYSMIFVCNLPP